MSTDRTVTELPQRGHALLQLAALLVGGERDRGEVAVAVEGDLVAGLDDRRDRLRPALGGQAGQVHRLESQGDHRFNLSRR